MKLRVSLALSLLAGFALASCSYLGSYRTENARYAHLVDKLLREERLFVRGEQRLSMKVMPGSEEMHKLQGTVSPGFEFKYKPERHQVIVAVSSKNRVPFSRDEIHFRLDGEKSVNVEELTSSFLIQTLYPYAFPYYRVFIVDFTGKAASERDFTLETSRGSLSVKLQFSPLP
jgi:hypothetical protein